ncbi:MAG: sterol desaturase family protein [Roseiarcus sp.]|jgi:sterol desaturase/sphingolipid hydroxylase (fatty acid hydroxylase superfamily)
MDLIASGWTSIIGQLQALFGPAAFVDRLHSVFGAGSPYGPIALTGALVFSLLFYVDARRKRGRRMSAVGFLRSVFPRRIVLHPSSRLDLRLWIVNTIVFASAYGLLAVGSVLWRDATLNLLTTAFGRHEPSALPVYAILTIVTLAQLLAYELGYWVGHYLFHVIPALWEFHKVHHSAEVMTTLTEMRTHPVEIIAFMNIIGLATGLAFGVMTYAFGPGLQPFTLLNLNIVLMLFIITIGHLRHSHMWIAFTGLAGRLFQSPAHHQIHHSDQPRHFNKNLGFALAVWDWLFGTLYVPETHEKITFGVGAEHLRYDTVLRTFALPFAASADHVVKWASGMRRRLGKGKPAIAPPAPTARISQG